MTASRNRKISFRRLPGRRPLILLLALIFAVPTFTMSAPVAPVSANDLSDAIAEQQRLARLIADQRAQLARLATQQASLTSQIASTRANLANVRTTIDQTESAIATVEAELVSASAGYNVLLLQQDVLQAEQARLAAQAGALQVRLAGRQAILAGRIVAAYEADQVPLLQQLLTAHSLTDALADVAYYSDLAAADKALADQIRADRKVLDQTLANVSLAAGAAATLTAEAAGQKLQLDDQHAQLEAARTSLAALRKQLEAQLAQQRAAEAAVAQNKAQLASMIASNGQALDDLGDRIDQLIGEQGTSGGIPSQYSGSFDWPMGGIITQEFGCTGVLSEPRVGSCAHFHQGIDIAAPCLTPVHAAAAGQVVFVGYNPYDAPPRAWLVIIAHSTSIVTWYAHMTAWAPTGIYVGANVAAGQLVGTENTTGHSTGCHLHWAVRVNGAFVNPRLFL